MRMLSLTLLLLAGTGVLATTKPKDCICTLDYRPVCGKDGKTYGNECALRCAGVEKKSDGECPCICTKDYKPVCGEDGKTYGNECQLKCAGVKKKSDGECPDGSHDKCCGSKERCCGNACIPKNAQTFAPCGKPSCCDKPDVCTTQYEPVCGKNGKTYGNACEAARVGAKVKCKGECPCKKPIAKCCTKKKPNCVCGQCSTKDPRLVLCKKGAPTTCCRVCTQEYQPVCGKNGKTYGNTCLAGKQPIACRGTCPCKKNCCKHGKFCCGSQCIRRRPGVAYKCAAPTCCKGKK